MNKNRVVNIVRVGMPSSNWRNWMNDSFRTISGITHMQISSEVDLVLAQETFQYTLASKADAPMQGLLEQVGQKGASGALLMMGEAINAATSGASATFNPWFKYVKAWQNMEPVQLPLNFEFKMGQFGLWDAKQEVVLPILSLLLPVLPKKLNSIAMEGPFQSVATLLALVLKGTVFNLAGEGDLSDAISRSVLGEVDKSTYRVSIGKQLLLDRAYCVSANVSLSTNVDQFGLPISGTIQLAYEGAMPPAINNSVARSLRFFNAD